RAEEFESLKTEERALGLRAWFWERRALQTRLATAQRQAEACDQERKRVEADQRAQREQLAIARFERDQLRKRHETVVEQCLRVEARQQLLRGNIDHADRESLQIQETLTDNAQRLVQLEARSQDALEARA